MIKGETPEEIRNKLRIKNDFTPSEEEQVHKENEWCEEKYSLYIPLQDHRNFSIYISNSKTSLTYKTYTLVNIC